MKSLTSLFHDKLQEAGYHNSTCCFCGIRQGSQMAHILANTIAYKKDIEKAFDCNSATVQRILDMPLLNTIWSCSECNGLGDTKIAKVCKTADLTYIHKAHIKATISVLDEVSAKIKVKKNYKILASFLDFLGSWGVAGLNELEDLKLIQYDFQRIVLGHTA